MITNDGLARMIAEGFAQTASKIELQAVEQRLTGRIDGVDNRLTRVEDRLTTVESKLDRALYVEYSHLEHRVTRLEKKTGIV